MARSSSVILASLKTALQTLAATLGIVINPDNWSQTDYKLLILQIFADSQSVQEQLYDSFIEDVEDIVSRSPNLVAAYIQYIMINVFEYDAVANPIFQLDTNTSFAPFYANPNPAFNIVKFCSVVPVQNGITLIKIAKAGPSQMSTTELSAAQTFVNAFVIPGINFNAQSLTSDKTYLTLDVYYIGYYGGVISANVTAAISNYLGSINFNGKIVLNDLIEAIRSVQGVTDADIINLAVRPDTGDATSYNYTVHSNQINSLSTGTTSGYAVLETLTGYTLTDNRVDGSGLPNLNLISQ